jgi:uncharacterized protein (UPF0332 family)
MKRDAIAAHSGTADAQKLSGWSTSFLDSAEYLLRQIPVSESNRRSAISRAYYSTFHSALAFLRARKIYHPASKHSQHVNVIHSMEAAGFNQEAQTLRRMREYRNQADYVGSMDALSVKCEYCMTQSKALLSRFSQKK